MEGIGKIPPFLTKNKLKLGNEQMKPKRKFVFLSTWPKTERMIFVFGIDKRQILCQYIVDEEKTETQYIVFNRLKGW